MVPKAPGENARSRARRPNHEHWFAGFVLRCHTTGFAAWLVTTGSMGHGGSASNPETAALPHSQPCKDSLQIVQGWKSIFQMRLVVMAQVVVSQQHFELAVECEEGLEKVLFAPEAELVDNPVATIIERQKNVVDVNDDAWLETR